MALSDYVVTDDLTILLALVAVALFLVQNLYRPQPLVHPILLGRQSDAARVRNPTESAVYRNYGTGIMGRFPLRPNKDVQSVLDFLRLESDAPRTLWSTKITNAELRQRIRNVAAGFVRRVGLVPGESNVLLLLNDGLEFVISDFALASQSITSLTISSISLLGIVLKKHKPSAIITQPEFVPHILKLSQDGHHSVIVVGELSSAGDYSKLDVIKFSDIEKDGSNASSEFPLQIEPNSICSISFSGTPSGEVEAVQFTHQNFTAGVTSARSLVPVSSAISSLDTILSAHSLSTPYGRVVAYTALFEGASFATLQSSKLLGAGKAISSDGLRDLDSAKSYDIPSPTILFIKPLHLKAISSSILDEAQKSFFLYALAWRHKMSGAAEGFVTKDSLWDRLVFDNARVKFLGQGAGTLRGVIVADGTLDLPSLMPARIALSVPLVNVAVHPFVAGPVLASHPFDLQNFPPSKKIDKFSSVAHVGSPSINLEVKLIGVDDATIEGGGDPVGDLVVRGPPVGKLPLLFASGGNDEEQWVPTGLAAKVMTNGTFLVTSTTI